MTKTCPECGLPPDLCNCESHLRTLESMCPISDRKKCEICGKMCYGLMDFASHVFKAHNLSASQYWAKYGYKGGKQTDEKINPSKRTQE